MQLLTVHPDGEVGEQLVQMVKDYRAHECDFVHSNGEATKSPRHAQGTPLVTQLKSSGRDGFILGGMRGRVPE
jgi:hypothetical protein